jgi:hypothetical protein
MIFITLSAIVLLVNLAPAFVPPTWTVLVYFIIKYHLYLPYVVLCGVTAATFGRYLLSKYIDLIAHLLFNSRQIENISYLGMRLGKTQLANFLFTFMYSLTPLSTTALFVAAGIAEVKLKMVLLGFFCGRLISYTILGLSARALSKNVMAMADGGLNVENIIAVVLTLLVFFVFVFIDWKALFEKKKIRLHFDVWKWSRQEMSLKERIQDFMRKIIDMFRKKDRP